MTHNERPTSALRAFLASGAAGGIILMAAAALAMIVANSALGGLYHDMLHTPISPALTEKLGPMTAHLWINDGLMAIFFLFVGLEIKRELVDGRLSTWQQRRLPVVAAIAGMAVPAAVYLLFAGSEPALVNGWAIPAATDIAFAIGVLALLGRRAPTSLKLFLVTVAIVDDMGAVAIIALFYTAGLAIPALVAAAVILAAMFALNRLGVRSLPIYLIGFALLWYAVLLSGVHATIAGVLAAFAVPIIHTPGNPDSPDSPLHKLEHALDAPVAYFIVPLFGFANAGVALAGISIDEILAPMPVGIAAGLFLGKQLGIFGAVWLAVKSGFAAKPRGATWLQIYAVAVICGIGFTMSLFIGGLAFADPELVEEAKLGTLAGSILAALTGYVLLRFAPPHPGQTRQEVAQAEEIANDGDVERICADRGQ
ncbi:sodium:proton antiporter [Sphingopyxis sp. H038]|uniref:Na+/H+ antiporter NhaA n=1 Tax=unclassified Sphingopyxis TaxID=2614943 RepID=UPI0007305D2E|nr:MULTISPECIES: Na+/H+ antiporter NhaA [unclassified Sphingopyxis]KTD99951.1 sodium:proton antiporter [Sphingopyxis sp. H012]KTE07136.1 sodium:proton antiporter [Sphingopyxis sp. H053]KTE09038.1 sodium:proton antiporter [Sphingopyxis sp. H093]KTE25315.1 sodium:proton antiporter [Sphingopyxis sp. H080]KTE36338.1 sodium:proton antiporter [Sphingopyxis sp. H038]